MPTEIALGLIVLVALACPVHMLWRMRRRREPACGVTARPDLEALRSRQRALEEEIARREASAADGEPPITSR